MDGVFDALVTAAAADITRHRFAYLIVSWFCVVHEERGGLHNLAGLAIAALRDIYLAPGLLNGVITRWMKAFDRRDLPVDHVGNRSDAGAYGVLTDNNGACATESLAATKLRARQSDFITEKPEQRKIRVAVPISFLAVNLHLDHDRSSLSLAADAVFDMSEQHIC
jgi:hypothetical protein